MQTKTKTYITLTDTIHEMAFFNRDCMPVSPREFEIKSGETFEVISVHAGYYKVKFRNECHVIIHKRWCRPATEEKPNLSEFETIMGKTCGLA